MNSKYWNKISIQCYIELCLKGRLYYTFKNNNWMQMKVNLIARKRKQLSNQIEDSFSPSSKKVFEDVKGGFRFSGYWCWNDPHFIGMTCTQISTKLFLTQAKRGFTARRKEHRTNRPHQFKIVVKSSTSLENQYFILLRSPRGTAFISQCSTAHIWLTFLFFLIYFFDTIWLTVWFTTHKVCWLRQAPYCKRGKFIVS
jgi:hypothetical protein